MRSKFWGDDSDDYYSDSSDYSSNADEREQPKRQSEAPAWTLESSSDEDESRVVKSAKTKAREVILSHLKTINHLKKINDFSELLKNYDSLSKLVDKQYVYGRLPKLIVSLILDLTQFMDDQQKDKKTFKKFSKAKTIAFNTLRSRLRKFNEQHSEIIDEYTADPDNFYDILEQSDEDELEQSEEEFSEEAIEDEKVEEESLSEEDITSDEEKESDGDDSSSGWSESGTSSVSEIEDSDKHKSALAKWGVKKSETKVLEVKEKIAKKQPKFVKKKDEKEKQSVSSSSYGKLSAVLAVSEVISNHMKDIQLGMDDNPFNVLTPEIQNMLDNISLSEDAVRMFIRSIIEKRGKRGANTLENIRILQVLPYIAKDLSHALYLEVVETLIHSQFDSYSHAYGAMTPEQWVNTYRIVAHLVNELIEKPKSLLTPDEFNILSYSLADSNEVHPSTGSRAVSNEAVRASMSILLSIIQKLNDELYKGLLYTDVHHADYKTLLVYTIDMLYLLHRTLMYYLSNDRDGYEQATTTALIILEHVYYKEDGIASKIWELVKAKIKDAGDLRFLPTADKLPSDIVIELVNFVLVHGSHRDKIRASLHLAYNKSLHGHYYEARDLLLVSNLHEMAAETDISSQILLNRNLAQLGICAFRKGLIHEAYSYLMEICSQNRHKESLAQGLSNAKNQDKSAEQERAEKRRLLPYHMHLNIELIESVNNICALLLETANFAKSSLNNKEIISRQFRRMFEIHEKQVFVGPPENNREIILMAFKQLQSGNWKECYNNIISLNTWASMPDKDTVQATLKEIIKREAFRTFIFKYVGIYDSFSVDKLSSMFDLDKNVVHSLISKMIVAGEIHASWDDSSTCCLINHIEPTELQKLAIKLAENLTTVVEQNELTLNMKNSKFALSQDRRFQRDTKFNYTSRNDDGRISTLNFNRSKKMLQSNRQRQSTVTSR